MEKMLSILVIRFFVKNIIGQLCKIYHNGTFEIEFLYTFKISFLRERLFPVFNSTAVNSFSYISWVHCRERF